MDSQLFDGALIEACTAGGMQHIQAWLVRLGHTRPHCANRVAASGHLDVVPSLHDHGGVFTDGTMDVEAEFCHLDIVKWLHTKRNEGCTQRAMDSVALEGHEMVCSSRTKPMDRRLQPYTWRGLEKNLEIARWLPQNVDNVWEGSLINMCALYG